MNGVRLGNDLLVGWDLFESGLLLDGEIVFECLELT